MSASTLFSKSDLESLVGTTTTDRHTTAEKMTWGWLKPVLAIAERPTDVDDALFAWAIELGAIAHENPTGLATYQLGAERFGYSAERRGQILDEVRAWAADEAGGTSATRGGPAGSFPPAPTYPDPARTSTRPGWAGW